MGENLLCCLILGIKNHIRYVAGMSVKIDNKGLQWNDSLYTRK